MGSPPIFMAVILIFFANSLLDLPFKACETVLVVTPNISAILITINPPQECKLRYSYQSPGHRIL